MKNISYLYRIISFKIQITFFMGSKGGIKQLYDGQKYCYIHQSFSKLNYHFYCLQNFKKAFKYGGKYFISDYNIYLIEENLFLIITITS